MEFDKSNFQRMNMEMKLEFLMFTETARIFNNDDLGYISMCSLESD